MNHIDKNNETFPLLVKMPSLCSCAQLKEVLVSVKQKYILWHLFNEGSVEWNNHAIGRLVRIADDTQAAIVYSDFNETSSNSDSTIPHPLADYQSGSVRDDFDFGKVLLVRNSAMKIALEKIEEDYKFAGFYAMRLRLADSYGIIHLNESLYTYHHDSSSNEDSHFAYVDSKNREVQMEMELAFTHFLKSNGGYIPASTLKRVDFNVESFPCEASVIIPVRNRERTIADAIQSALLQQTDFKFNVIVVDNHSTDNTTSVIQSFALKNPQVIHVIPDTYNYGIGGCWNIAVTHPACGKFAIQLDSDDLYSSPNTLQQIVEYFYREQCAMLVGSYRLTNFDLDEIPPGLIDHKEWTAENGHNNLLRVNGIGAPRAFYTPIIRTILFPNVSYGEDYAVSLRISREYRIGRIFESLYNCRRWEGNSDARLTQEKLNQFNTYKDRQRTFELLARKHHDSL